MLLLKYFSLYGYFKEKNLFNLDPANESNNMTSQLRQITSLCQCLDVENNDTLFGIILVAVAREFSPQLEEAN